MFHTYIIASKRNGTLYVGHTDDLGRRIEQHKLKIFKEFAAKYDVHKLVWFEEHETRDDAFTRERQIKKWKRAWKLRLIETDNPNWLDIMSGSIGRRCNTFKIRVSLDPCLRRDERWDV